MAGALCVPAAAVTITASNVQTRMRPPRFMYRKLERIEVANLDFIRLLSSCTPCRRQRDPNANTFLALPHRAKTVQTNPPSGGRRRKHHPLSLLQRSGAITRHTLDLFSRAL